jgi:hypothetical protein
VFAYVDRGIEDIKEALKLKPVQSSSNVTLIVPYDRGVFYDLKRYDEMPVVSPVQLYLDLISYKGRGEDAAQFLLEQVIEPLWLQKQDTEKEK